jgi:hypothetical protein
MNLDKSEYRQIMGDKKLEQDERHRPQSEQQARQAVKMSELTGDENWDLFKSFLEAAMDDAEKAMKFFNNQMTNPSIVDPNAIAQAKLNYHICRERYATLSEVVTLPNEVIKSGEAAKDLLSRLNPLIAKEEPTE